MNDPPLVSVVIPTRNEAGCIAATLASLRSLRAGGHEVIVVDAGSTDATQALASEQCDRIITSSPGRARQQNAGAQIARGDVFWFVHADTQISGAAADELFACLAKQPNCWGRFDIRFTSPRPLLSMVAALTRSRQGPARSSAARRKTAARSSQAISDQSCQASLAASMAIWTSASPALW